MKEIWKDISEYTGLYQVSNYGNVRNIKTSKKLKPGIKRGYYQVGLIVNKKRKWYSVHRLVAKEFIPNTENLPQINHKDENKLNNNVNNLEWCTVSYNNCYGTRLKRVKEKVSKKVLQYDLNGNFIKEYNSLTEATKLNNIKSIGNISMCCNGKYKHVKGYIWRYKGVVSQ